MIHPPVTAPSPQVAQLPHSFLSTPAAAPPLPPRRSHLTAPTSGWPPLHLHHQPPAASSYRTATAAPLSLRPAAC